MMCALLSDGVSRFGVALRVWDSGASDRGVPVALVFDASWNPPHEPGLEGPGERVTGPQI